MWQHERNDWDQATCTDWNCSFANNCAPNAQFGCGHFTQNVWKSTTHVCYQVGFRKHSVYGSSMMKLRLDIILKVSHNAIEIGMG